IRDLTVTGVQTCALPIYAGSAGWRPSRRAPRRRRPHGDRDADEGDARACEEGGSARAPAPRRRARAGAEGAPPGGTESKGSKGRSEERRVGKEGRKRRGG